MLGLQFPVIPFVLVGACIAFYNVVFLLLSSKGRKQNRSSGRFASFQVAVDLLALTVLMHLGGGIENPFVSYYLFHTIIAAILLPWWKVVLQVLFASSCMAGLAVAELTGALPHRHIGGLLPIELYADWKFVMVAIFALITTLSVAAFLAASIAQRLRERDEELQLANAELAEQDRIKSQYVMQIAHDLAGPAGMITSCLKVVTEGLAGPVSEGALDMVQRAEQRSEYVGHLVRDLLSLSRIKAAKRLPKAAVDLAEAISQVFEDLQPRATRKSVTLDRDLPEGLPAVYGNAVALRELLENLLTNAVKYTLLEGHVRVSAWNSGGEVVVSVNDDGVGIPSEALPHVFEEFYRADNVKAEAVEGTGLGLAIVRQILKAHGGRIWVDSVEGKGATFSFALPAVGASDAQ
jgi:signal transduction histidine kinase